MGGYASIPLSGVFPQINTPLQTASQAAQVANARLSNQIGQQELIQKQIQTRQQQLQMQQLQMFMQAPDTAAPERSATPSSDNSQDSYPDNATDDTGAPMQPQPQQAAPMIPGQMAQNGASPLPQSAPRAAAPISAIPGIVAQGNAASPLGATPIPQQAPPAGPLPQQSAPASMGLSDFAQSGPAATAVQAATAPPVAPQAAPISPAVTRAFTPEAAAANMNFNDVGSRFANKLRNYMSMPGSNVMFAKQMYDGYIEQQTKLATLQKDQLATQKTANDQRANAIDNVIQTPEGPERNQAWTNLLAQGVRNGRLTPQQFQQYSRQVPTTDQLTHLRNQNLLMSEQAEMASKQATAQQAVARGKLFQTEADGKQYEQDVRQANATLTDDPAKFDVWKSSLPANVQKTLASVNDPYRARNVLTALAAPASETDKIARQQQQDLIGEGVAAAKAGPAQYGRWYGRVEASNPRFAERLVKPDDYDEDTTPKDINDLGLSPEQRVMGGHRDQTEENATRRLDQADQRIAIENRRTDAMVEHLARISEGQLTPGQQAVQDRFDRRQWVTLRNSEDALHSRRNDLYAQLQTGKDSKGNTVDPVTARNALKSVEDSIQNKQYQKADAMNIDTPDKDVINGMKDGATIPTGNPGVVWKKMGGIAYPVAASKQPAAAPPAATGPSAAPPPPSAAPPPPSGKPTNTPQTSGAPEPAANRLGKQTGQRPGSVDVGKLQSWASQNPNKRAFNRTTGAAVEWNGKAWVPAQVQ